MPTVKLLLHDSNVTLKPPSPPPHATTAHQRQPFAPQGTTPLIYYALAAVLVAVVFFVRFAARRFSHHLPSSARGPPSWQQSVSSRKPDFPKDSKSSHPWERSAPTSTSTPSPKPLFYRPGCERGAQTLWSAGLLASPADQVRTGLTASVPGMEEQRDRTGSRGVSISAAGTSRRQVSSPRADPGSRKSSSRSPRSRNSRSSSRRHSSNNSSDRSTWSKPKGKGLMDGDNWGGIQNQDTSDTHMLDGPDGAAMHSQDSGRAEFEHGASASAPIFSRPPPPPPLTPPTLYTGAFTFEDRRPSYAVSIPAKLDSSFIHQPNPDYLSSSSSAEYRAGSPKSDTGHTATPRRRSYTKTIPMGIPTMPSGSSSSSSHHTADMTWGVSSTDTFSPASYPPSSPQLPPPPPGAFDEVIYDYDDGQSQEEEIDLQGEIISVMDDAGHGWKRHTRVYGGGVCLACIAAGDRQGGFYGDKVPLSERR